MSLVNRIPQILSVASASVVAFAIVPLSSLVSRRHYAARCVGAALRASTISQTIEIRRVFSSPLIFQSRERATCEIYLIGGNFNVLAIPPQELHKSKELLTRALKTLPFHPFFSPSLSRLVCHLSGVTLLALSRSPLVCVQSVCTRKSAHTIVALASYVARARWGI